MHELERNALTLPVVSGRLPLPAVAVGHGGEDEGDELANLHVDLLSVRSLERGLFSPRLPAEAPSVNFASAADGQKPNFRVELNTERLFI